MSCLISAPFVHWLLRTAFTTWGQCETSRFGVLDLRADMISTAFSIARSLHSIFSLIGHLKNINISCNLTILNEDLCVCDWLYQCYLRQRGTKPWSPPVHVPGHNHPPDGGGAERDLDQRRWRLQTHWHLRSNRARTWYSSYSPFHSCNAPFLLQCCSM